MITERRPVYLGDGAMVKWDGYGVEFFLDNNSLEYPVSITVEPEGFPALFRELKAIYGADLIKAIMEKA